MRLFNIYFLQCLILYSSTASADDASIQFERQMEVTSRCFEAAREIWPDPIVLPDAGGLPGYDVAVVAGPRLSDAYRPVFVCLVDAETDVVRLSKGLDISPLLPGARALTGE